MSKKLWCAMCGKWGDHQSGSCPELRDEQPVPSPSNRSDCWVSNEAQYRKVLESIVKYGERHGIKRVVQYCGMTLNDIDVFTNSRCEVKKPNM